MSQKMVILKDGYLVPKEKGNFESFFFTCEYTRKIKSKGNIHG